MWVLALLIFLVPLIFQGLLDDAACGVKRSDNPARPGRNTKYHWSKANEKKSIFRIVFLK